MKYYQEEYERGYYEDYDDFTSGRDDNLIGYGVDVEKPLNDLGLINFNTGSKRIRQCIEDILSTPVGSRFFNPEYGSRLYSLVEEQNDFIVEDMAELYVSEAIAKFEPRVSVESVVAQVDSEDDKTLLIKITYRIKDMNELESFVYSFNRKIPEMR